MLNRRCFIRNGVAVFAPFSLLNLVAAGEREQELARIKARAALAISELPLPPPHVAAIETDTRPVIYKYGAKWCGPCKRAAADLKAYAGELPFRIVEWDVDTNSNGYSGKIPAWSWRTPKGTNGFIGWYGVDHLIKRWKDSQAPAPVTAGAGAPNAYPQMKGYAPVYNWPGSLREHVRNFHRQGSLVDSLTQDQLEALHDKIHGVRVRPY